MPNTISPNMSLVIPGVGTEIGPNWAIDLNADLSILDGHNHSVGYGVQIQPNGININSDLSFNSNNATDLRSTRYAPQTAVLSLPDDIGCLYVVNNELYYNDVTGGNQIQITNSGSVNAGAGSITGLPSGTASASYSAGVFTWQAATSTPANMDAGSYVFRNNLFASNGLTLSPPAAMASNTTITLPNLPASQSFLTIDAGGAITGYASINQGISRDNLVAVGEQISASSGLFTTFSAVYVPVTNLTVTITTTGRPVMVFCQSDTGSTGYLVAGAGATSAAWVIKRSGSVDIYASVTLLAVGRLPSSALHFLDTPSAGTYTYTVEVQAGGGGNVSVFDTVLVAYEL